MSNIKNQIKQILSDFGMKGKRAAEIMGLPHSTLKKINSDVEGYAYKQEHLTNLQRFIIEYALNINVKI